VPPTIAGSSRRQYGRRRCACQGSGSLPEFDETERLESGESEVASGFWPFEISRRSLTLGDVEGPGAGMLDVESGLLGPTNC
jgi:hypothetical protein